MKLGKKLNKFKDTIWSVLNNIATVKPNPRMKQINNPTLKHKEDCTYDIITLFNVMEEGFDSQIKIYKIYWFS